MAGLFSGKSDTTSPDRFTKPSRLEQTRVREEGREAHTFTAELDVAEVDHRDRPTQTWSARAATLGRSVLTLHSRRMCYEGTRLIAAIHLVDDRPAVLFGTIQSCEYDTDGLYRINLRLEEPPISRELGDWVKQHALRSQ